VLSPAFDINPVASGDGLKLNISETDDSQDLELAKEVAEFFRIKKYRADEIIREITHTVKRWNDEATSLGISTREKEKMTRAFRIAFKEK
jgi:serine/threonine-protein kinase HipA